MRRKITAIALVISFVAMASSGLLMFIVDRPSFTLRMHPVHKFFGIVLIAAAISHLSLNGRALIAHIKDRVAAAVAVVLTLVLVATYSVVALSPVPPEQAQQLDEMARRIEGEADPNTKR